jgi:DNA polymerase III subunit alpha
MNRAFVHLHVHTEYSVMEGMCRLENRCGPNGPLMERARELGQDAMAITDSGNLHGAVYFYKSARKHGIKPILGCEIQMALQSRLDVRRPNGREENPLVLLAENDRGFANLIRLVSMAHLDCFPDKPRMDWGLLAAYNEGLIVLSGGSNSEISQALIRGEEERARQMAAAYAGVMGKDRFYLELQDHGLPSQQIANRGLVKLARELGLPMVATNDVRYLRAEHAVAHEMLLCLQAQAKWSDAGRKKNGSDQYYLKSDAEMRRLFCELPEAIDNTWKIAERCSVELALGRTGGANVPRLNGLTPLEYLRQIAAEGVRRRYGVEDLDRPKDDSEKTLANRFAGEMETIEKAGGANHFLVAWDCVRAAKEMGIPVGPGRGASAGSLVAYSMGITGIDPLKHGLLFERFLNPENLSRPVFEVDVCGRRRGEVIDYVKNKYGEDRVAQIVTFYELGAITLIRQIGSALEMAPDECDRLARMGPDSSGPDLEAFRRENEEIRNECIASDGARRIMAFAPPLEGLPRTTGTHVAALVVSDRPLIESIPLMRNNEGEVVSQWDSDCLESMGLLKTCIRGLKPLTAVRDACDVAKRTKGLALDPEHLPLEDPKTYALLARGDTDGVWQLESKRMRHYLRQLRADHFEEIVAVIALFRPCGLKTLPKVIARKRGRAKVRYAHPLLEGILQETYGILVYQEQLQQAVGALAGFSLGQGDSLRRILGKKKPGEVAEQRRAFIDGCVKRKTCTPAKAGRIFDRFAEVADCLFNKSHAVSYGLLTFQTAYLKAHHPYEFLEAIQSTD